LDGYVSTKNRKPRTVRVPVVPRDYLDEYLLSTDADEHFFGSPRFVNGRRAALARDAKSAVCRSSTCTRRSTHTPRS
jgi:hypothetical protein